MKKLFIFIIILGFLYFLYNYFFHDYEIVYNIGAYEITEKYSDNRYYFEIEVDGSLYNFDLYGKKLNKKIISKIDDVSASSYYCLYPHIKGTDTYPICSNNGNIISYNLINESTINTFIDELNIKYAKVDYVDEKVYYYDNLSRNTYIALYAYDGYYVINNKEIEFIEMFDNEEYSNDYAYQFNKYIITPDYDDDYEYDTFKLLDVYSKKVYDVESKVSISNDFYYVGYNKMNVYIFDNKFNVLYELNTIKRTIEEICNETSGYIKYVDGKEESARLNDYKINKITYNKEAESNYEYSIYDGVYKRYKDNDNINIKIIDDYYPTIIDEYEDSLYYLIDDKFYEYNPLGGSKLVFNYYELNFNNSNNIFVFNK